VHKHLKKGWILYKIIGLNLSYNLIIIKKKYKANNKGKSDQDYDYEMNFKRWLIWNA